MSASWRSARDATLIGLGATATMDVAGHAIRHATGVAGLDYALVGRWLGHMPQGQFTHPSIHAAAPVKGEGKLGLAAHYGIGIAFAGLLIAARPRWTQRPTLAPALAVGLGSTAAPYVLMQPAFGMGLAASKTPDPTTVRLRSARTHAIYGLGLYLSGQTLARLRGPR